MKKNRQQVILDIINNNAVETQEDLQKQLTEKGFKVTQATVSRDIKELNIVKYKNGRTIKYIQALSNNSTTASYPAILSNAVTSFDRAVNTLVVKCHIGTAQAVAAAIDNISMPEIMGTIAGDDTLLVITKNEEVAMILEKKFKTLFK